MTKFHKAFLYLYLFIYLRIIISEINYLKRNSVTKEFLFLAYCIITKQNELF